MNSKIASGCRGRPRMEQVCIRASTMLPLKSGTLPHMVQDAVGDSMVSNRVQEELQWEVVPQGNPL